MQFFFKIFFYFENVKERLGQGNRGKNAISAFIVVSTLCLAVASASLALTVRAQSKRIDNLESRVENQSILSETNSFQSGEQIRDLRIEMFCEISDLRNELWRELYPMSVLNRGYCGR